MNSVRAKDGKKHVRQSILADDTDLLGFNPQFHLELSEPLPADETLAERAVTR